MATVEVVPKPNAAVIETGDFRIDLAARTVIVRGRELRLSSEEFNLLLFLTSHPKKMATPATVLSPTGRGRACVPLILAARCFRCARNSAKQERTTFGQSRGLYIASILPRDGWVIEPTRLRPA